MQAFFRRCQIPSGNTQKIMLAVAEETSPIKVVDLDAVAQRKRGLEKHAKTNDKTAYSGLESQLRPARASTERLPEAPRNLPLAGGAHGKGTGSAVCFALSIDSDAHIDCVVLLRPARAPQRRTTSTIMSAKSAFAEQTRQSLKHRCA